MHAGIIIIIEHRLVRKLVRTADLSDALAVSAELNALSDAELRDESMRLRNDGGLSLPVTTDGACSAARIRSQRGLRQPCDERECVPAALRLCPLSLSPCRLSPGCRSGRFWAPPLPQRPVSGPPTALAAGFRPPGCRRGRS